MDSGGSSVEIIAYCLGWDGWLRYAPLCLTGVLLARQPIPCLRKRERKDSSDSRNCFFVECWNEQSDMGTQVYPNSKEEDS